MASTPPSESISRSLERITTFIQAFPMFEHGGANTREPSFMGGRFLLEDGVYSQRILFEVQRPDNGFNPPPLISLQVQTLLCHIYRMQKLSDEELDTLRLLPEDASKPLIDKFDAHYEAYLLAAFTAITQEKDRYMQGGKWDLGDDFNAKVLDSMFIGVPQGR
ncbi:hypothetical protein T440DRAFT_513838 [Plenodomus tracheiphilus IPT5]|uniref:Uncharacterized protein n=1 Tax=Plenodomus tracheiphilus IPT5 TaxID=1408161 RepID=A0A6A7BLR5_9PLEO|nr:hypothetical protein T440DRAFT_513838 [Plenodomus tracheiphilus IPT5]